MAAMLVAALGWPSTAGARGRAAPEVEVPTTTAEPEAEQPTEPLPKVGLTPEEMGELAGRHWQEGRRLYDNGRYAEAAVEFERSYAAVPAADTLYNQALSYERAGKPVEAVRGFQRYLALPDCEDRPPEERTSECPTKRPEAQAALAELQLRVGELVLSLGEGVRLREVRVDGRVVPLQDFPFVLLPGTVDVEVLGLGPEERRTRAAYITGGETTTFYVAPFEPRVATPSGPTTDPDDEVDTVDELRLERRRLALKTSFWVGTGLTAASATAMTVMGALTRYHHRRFDEELCARVCPPDDIKPYPADHEAKFQRYKPTSTALVGVTVGLAVATALLGSFAFRKPARERAGKLEARVRPRVRVGATGLVVRW
jgi:hypothetical protein